MRFPSSDRVTWYLGLARRKPSVWIRSTKWLSGLNNNNSQAQSVTRATMRRTTAIIFLVLATFLLHSTNARYRAPMANYKREDLEGSTFAKNVTNYDHVFFQMKQRMILRICCETVHTSWTVPFGTRTMIESKENTERSDFIDVRIKVWKRSMRRH